MKLLMRVFDPAARQWYALEAVSQTWSVAALDRQISTLYYQRLLSSQNQDGVKAEANALIQRDAPPHPRDFIRDPYILEFLSGQPQASWYEKDLEQGLLDQLQKFLLELGKGFAFVARQRHLRIEDEDAFVDLVFYNYILKCFVLIELKVGRLSHQDVGQLDMYVRVFDAQIRQPGDNPNGIINLQNHPHVSAGFPTVTYCTKNKSTPCQPHLFNLQGSYEMPSLPKWQVDIPHRIR